MRKVILVLLVGLFWCNTSFAEKKQVRYVMYAKALAPLFSAKSSILPSYNIERSKMVRIGKDDQVNFFLKTAQKLKKKCERGIKSAGWSINYTCVISVIKYYEPKNPSNNQKIVNRFGIDLDNIQVSWNGIKDLTAAERAEEEKRIAEEKKKAEEKRIAEEKKRIAEEKKKAEEKRIAEEKAREAEYERLEAKYRKKCKKAYFNPKGFEKGTPEYKSCILDLEKQEIAKAEEKKRIAEEKKKAEEERIAQENKLNEIDPDLIPIATGSGFFVSRDGHIITNEHVAGICELLAIKVGGRKHYLNVITTDQVNDLGLLQGNYKNPKYLEIDIEGPNLGEEIVTMGYPLGSFTGAGVKITKGIVSSLSGPGNNYSEFQIDAAIGPGSSGGPVINKSAQVVGVAYGGINKMKAIKEQEHIPENINFAISSQTLTTFLKANKVNYTKAYRDKKLDTEVIAQIGDAATVHLYCLNTEEFYTALKKAESHTDILLDLK